ncbi:DNA polymerase delta, regulatory subunit 55 [Pseudoloma neurophilia]|uniref:DNA polymerase delta, regulatory subunit 55 n=1 Tax=Pseudoloma neurophilia TaxID=146866 RepID=A0A0R0LVP9_9MICR|nr:DNA polymerase delta, regulatory subunit 55 [Pseudoloma neurophilia]
MANEELFTNNQYNLTYIGRLSKLLPLIDLKKIIKDDSVKVLSGLGQLEETDLFFAIKGVFLIVCKNKETIFDECSLIPKPIVIKPYGEFSYFIEDHSARIQVYLKDDFDMEKLPISGQILGFTLHQDRRKIFITDFTYPIPLNMSQNTPLTLQKSTSESQPNNKICFIASPEIKDQTETLKLLLSKLMEEKTVTDLVLIGKFGLNNSRTQIENLIDLLKSLNVKHHIIPNIGDPTNGLFPLTPINKRIFNLDATFHSNPAHFTIGQSFQFVPEQSIESIKLYYDRRSTNKILKNILDGRITCPTAPDTLGCLPSKDERFFIDQPIDHIFTISDELTLENTEDAMMQTLSLDDNKNSGINIFTLPRFSQTQKIVFYDCETREFESYQLEFE